MFNQLLIKTIQIGERVFHVLCDVNINLDDFEKLGLEIIKVAQDMKNAAKPADPVVKEESPPEIKPEA